MEKKVYYLYIVTNPTKTVLYVGVTNDLHRRLKEHYENRGSRKTFAGRYYCHKLVYCEGYESAYDAISREKQIKKWSRAKKDKLIEEMNPNADSRKSQKTSYKLQIKLKYQIPMSNKTITFSDFV